MLCQCGVRDGAPSCRRNAVPKSPTTIIEELVAAARGVVGIVAGDRKAANLFDFSPRGLAGSFIAFLVATTFSAYVPLVSTDAGAQLPPGRLLLMAAFLFAIQIGFSALVLRQINRMDGLVPYLVADNWATFFVTILSSLLGAFGLAGDFVLVVVGILVLVIEINIARLIVTLTPWQIAIFLIAQLVGVSVGLLLIGLVFPLPPNLMTPPA
jgi:hypothetical protein